MKHKIGRRDKLSNQWKLQRRKTQTLIKQMNKFAYTLGRFG